ncbi:hypothetical protein D1AOALGA4SA_7454 [Olavius algarvensis Delta 1 endosymbiont]|nr:hypothetical protein D1AOALGA4SA_7454 [Olavius algarvensis Delta 1 endosymbiont]
MFDGMQEDFTGSLTGEAGNEDRRKKIEAFWLRFRLGASPFGLRPHESLCLIDFNRNNRLNKSP